MSRVKIVEDHRVEAAGHRWIVHRYEVTELRGGAEGVNLAFLRRVHRAMALEIARLQDPLTEAEREFLVDHLELWEPGEPPTERSQFLALLERSDPDSDPVQVLRCP